MEAQGASGPNVPGAHVPGPDVSGPAGLGSGDSDLEAARALLERAGLEATWRRVVVLREVAQSGHPLAANEIYERARRERMLNLATVYRILELFTEHGVVNKVATGERAFMYCARGRWPHGHCHFHCLRCGAVSCIDNDRLPFSREAIEASMPMKINRVDLRLDGVCPACESAGK